MKMQVLKTTDPKFKQDFELCVARKPRIDYVAPKIKFYRMAWFNREYIPIKGHTEWMPNKLEEIIKIAKKLKLIFPYQNFCIEMIEV